MCTVFWGCWEILKQGFYINNIKDFLHGQIISFVFGYATSQNGVKEVGVIWFLAALIFAQIIFNIIEHSFSNTKIKLFIIVIIYVVGECICYHAVIPWWIASGGTRFLVWLSLGYYFKRYFDDIKCISRAKCFAINIVMVTLWAIYMILTLSGYRVFRFGALAPIIFVLWISGILGRNNTVSFIMEWIGQNTMLIMCIHSFGISCMDAVWIKLGFYNVSNPVMMIWRMTITIFIAFILSLVRMGIKTKRWSVQKNDIS